MSLLWKVCPDTREPIVVLMTSALLVREVLSAFRRGLHPAFPGRRASKWFTQELEVLSLADATLRVSRLRRFPARCIVSCQVQAEFGGLTRNADRLIALLPGFSKPLHLHVKLEEPATVKLRFGGSATFDSWSCNRSAKRVISWFQVRGMPRRGAPFVQEARFAISLKGNFSMISATFPETVRFEVSASSKSRRSSGKPCL
jgi:hypothetical protein